MSDAKQMAKVRYDPKVNFRKWVVILSGVQAEFHTECDANEFASAINDAIENEGITRSASRLGEGCKAGIEWAALTLRKVAESHDEKQMKALIDAAVTIEANAEYV
ncbi:MAG: hypothetical protein ACPGXK_00100 [Phycisphaerae bacterium]